MSHWVVCSATTTSGCAQCESVVLTPAEFFPQLRKSELIRVRGNISEALLSLKPKNFEWFSASVKVQARSACRRRTHTNRSPQYLDDAISLPKQQVSIDILPEQQAGFRFISLYNMLQTNLVAKGAGLLPSVVLVTCLPHPRSLRSQLCQEKPKQHFQLM